MAGFDISDRSMILILPIAPMFVTVSVAYRDWDNGGDGDGGFNYTTDHWPWVPGNDTCYINEPNKIIVGGSGHWRYGFNYSVLASQIPERSLELFKYNPCSKPNPVSS
ncbi:hypothetical protein Ddye_003720 [Dipteronia dyeriana]|uniref:Uncharacterized protein n=1 Tax=Dipteronia dyeriana TaxID=168575 RepID=A0AAD9XSS5_9ROSI|nr:hypothetical protein Ddye_003720 [Dipteronia dyeriana]